MWVGVDLEDSDEGEQDCTNGGGDHEHRVHGQRSGSLRELMSVPLDHLE